MSEEKLCFVIAPIGEDGSETRERSDKILKYVITPPVEELGYEPIRADQISEPGMITSQVIEHIVEDPLVIADLTERNPNVFYELAIRHAIRKPLVQIIRTGERIPFDVAGTRTIFVDHRDLDSVEEAKREIKAQVEALEEGAAEIDTPISMALDLQMLRRSEDPEDRSLGEILAAISEVRTSVASIERAIYGRERRVELPGGIAWQSYSDRLEALAASVLRQMQSRDTLATAGYSSSLKELNEAMRGARDELAEAVRRVGDDKSVDEDEGET